MTCPLHPSAREHLRICPGCGCVYEMVKADMLTNKPDYSLVAQIHVLYGRAVTDGLLVWLRQNLDRIQGEVIP